MSSSAYLEAYIDGVRSGNVDRICSILHDSFVLNDPDPGEIPKVRYRLYFTSRLMTLMRCSQFRPGRLLLEADSIVTHEEKNGLTAWVHWKCPGTSLDGASLLKAGPSGVLSEQVFNKAPARRD